MRHQAVIHRTQRNRALALCNHHAGQRRLAGLADGLAQHRIYVTTGIAVRRKEIGRVVVHRVD